MRAHQAIDGSRFRAAEAGTRTPSHKHSNLPIGEKVPGNSPGGSRVGKSILDMALGHCERLRRPLDPPRPDSYLRGMEILLGVGLFGLAIAALSMGTILFRRPIKGSCGGVANAMGDQSGSCSVCGRDYSDCPEKEAKAVS